MAGVPFPFALTSMPGQRPGESQGELINCYAVKKGDEVHFQRTPGLDRWTPALAEASRRIPRGMLNVDNYLLVAAEDRLEWVDAMGAIYPSTGEVLIGEKPVTMARNGRQQPEVIITTDNGTYYTDPATMELQTYPTAAIVADPLYADSAARLGAANAVEHYAGYFFWTRPDGTIVGSDLLNAGIPALSFDQARQVSDETFKPFNAGDTLLIMGSKSVEAWVDVGKTPFPLQFASVMNVGMLGRDCVAGGPQQWEHGVFFVASDYTVRAVDGYQAVPVSHPDVERDIYEARLVPDGFHAQVNAVDGQAIFSVSHYNWCWQFNLKTGAWHKRKSWNTTGWWRGRSSTQFKNSWYVQDLKKDGLLEITPEYHKEDDEPLVARMTSAPLKDFPLSVRVPLVHIDCSVGIGRLGQPYNIEQPAIQISWSHNGGASFGNPLIRSLGQQGQYSTLVKVHNLGRTTHHGMMLRLEVSDPVPFVIRGAIAPTLKPSRPRQVAR